MKKYALLLIVFALLQFSCSKDDDGVEYKPDQVFQESQFLGYWSHTATKDKNSDAWDILNKFSFDVFELKKGNILNFHNGSPSLDKLEVGDWSFDGKNILSYTLKDGSNYQLKLISIVDRELIAEVKVTGSDGLKESGIWKYYKVVSSQDDYYTLFTGGFKVKDITNFMPLTIGDNSVIGIKDNKLWVGFFDENSREQLSEKIDKDDFSFEKTIYKGYGDYEAYTIKFVFVEKAIKDDFILLNFHLENEEDTYKNYLLWSTNSGKKIDLLNSRYNLMPWYNNSCVIWYERNMACLTEQGDTILSSQNYGGALSDESFPINYNYYINEKASADDEIIFYIGRLMDDGNSSWTGGIVAKVVPEEKNFKYTCNLVSKNASTWTFQVDITEYSGKKHSHTVEIDISGIKD